MCKFCLNYQLPVHATLSAPANSVEASGTQSPVFNIETVEDVSTRLSQASTRESGNDYVEIVDAPADVSTPYELVAGESFSGEISTLWTGQDWVKISLTAGETYWFSLDGSADLSDTWLKLRAADGSVLVWDDDAGPGGFSFLNFAPTTSGTYYLSIEAQEGWHTGTYTLTTGTRAPLPEPLFTDIEKEDAPDNTTTNYNLVVGDSFSGVLEDDNAHEVDWVRVSLEAGETYMFTLDTGSAYLTLSNDGGYYLTEADRDYATNTNLLVYKAYRSGDYYLGASSPAHSFFSGNYEITTRRLIADETIDATANTATTAEMSVGETFTGLTRGGSDTDWIRISLNANSSYLFELNNPGHFGSTFRLRSSDGSVVADNQNGSISYTVLSTGDYYLDVSGSTTSNSGYYELTANVKNESFEQIAEYLKSGYWGGQSYAFNVGPGGSLTVDITSLTEGGQYLAANALEAWAAVTGINFRFVSSGAQITFDDDDIGAYANFYNIGSTITSAEVNISTGWLNTYGTSLDSYSFQTYIHEIGHALGLGHAGNYDITATYGVDNLYLNDSWQASVMSYFDQEENTYIDASFAFLLSPMVADILAIQELYGTPTNVHTGNTTYGFNSTAGGYLDSFVRQNGAVAGTIVDSSGIDTLDFSGFSKAQKIDLRAKQASDIGGLDGNFFISRGTVIENAIGGSGDDVLIGNDADNILIGLGGNDILFGGYDNVTVRVETGQRTAFTSETLTDRQGGIWDEMNWLTGDFNGDGQTDLMKFWNDGGRMSADVHQSTGSGLSMERWSQRQGELSEKMQWYTGDFDGDGQTDLMKFWNDGGRMSADVHQSTGSGFDMKRWSQKQGGMWDEMRWFTGDFNGDGQTDLMKFWNDGGRMSADVHQSSGEGFGMARWSQSQGGIWDAMQWQTGDFNGDGLTDLVKFWDDDGRMSADVHLSTGSSFQMVRWATKQGGIWDAMQWQTGDFNGDGLTDLVKFWDDDGRMSADVHLSTGSSFQMVRWATKQGGIWDAMQWQTGDFNGDGQTDLVKYWNDDGRMSADVHLSGSTDFSMSRYLTKAGPVSPETSVNLVLDLEGDSQLDIVTLWNDDGRMSGRTYSEGVVEYREFDVSDILVGNSQADTFQFTKGGGVDIIEDFEDGLDRIELIGTDITYADLVISEFEDGTTDIYYKTDFYIRLRGVSVDQISAEDFI